MIRVFFTSVLALLVAQTAATVEKTPASELLQRAIVKENMKVEKSFSQTPITESEESLFAEKVADICQRTGGSILPLVLGEHPSVEPKFGHLPDAPIAGKKGLFLVFRRSERDPHPGSSSELHFELVAPRTVPVHGYDPTLEVIQGYGGNRAIFSRHRGAWKITQVSARRWNVTVRVYNIDPKAQALERVKLKLYFQQRGSKEDDEAEFTFKSIPL